MSSYTRSVNLWIVVFFTDQIVNCMTLIVSTVSMGHSRGDVNVIDVFGPGKVWSHHTYLECNSSKCCEHHIPDQMFRRGQVGRKLQSLWNLLWYLSPAKSRN